MLRRKWAKSSFREKLENLFQLAAKMCGSNRPEYGKLQSWSVLSVVERSDCPLPGAADKWGWCDIDDKM